MSTIKEELHGLVDRLPQEWEERALRHLRHMVDCPAPERDTTNPVNSTNPVNFDEVIGNHWRQVGQRLGIDVDQLPKNGGWSGGISGGRVELTKDWVSEDARHRLSQIDLRGQYIILLERMETVEGTKLRYEVRVFTDQSEGRAEVDVAVAQLPSQEE